MIFDKKGLFIPIKANYYHFFYYFQVNMVMKLNCGQFMIALIHFYNNEIFHGILEVEN
jgi:hypothetical protein